MAKSKKVLQSPNEGQSFNPADFTSYDAVNSPNTNPYSTGEVNTYNYERDNSLDRGNITPYDLPNLNDTRTEEQGALSTIGNDIGKFVGKTALNIVGGIAGTAYGVGSAIANGDVSKIWDNSFNDKVEAVDQGLDNIFKVYKSSDYMQQNILQKAFLHPLQFIDDTTEALSFTAGAVLTELATAGIGSEFLVPKALKYMKYLSEGADAAEATKNLTSVSRGILSNVGDFGTTVKQLATGASYESIVEARKATMDLRTKMYNDYGHDHPGEDMPQSVKDDIDNRLSWAGGFTYLSNLALVGSTNLAEFPKIFGLGYNTSKAAEGEIEKDAVTGLFSTSKKAFKDLSTIEKAGVILKNPYEEGIKEEGLQDVISNTNQQFFDRKNDDRSKNVVQRYLETTAHNLADTYTSKEGWNDIGMGMIIGGLGAPGRGALALAGKNSALGAYGYDNITNDKGEVTEQKRADIWTGGVIGAAQEHNEEYEKVKSIVDDLNNHTDIFKSMQANHDFLVQSQSLQDEKEKALSANDIFNFQNAKDDQIHAYTSARIKSGMYEDVLDTIDSMKKLSPDEFYSQFKGEKATNDATTPEKTRFQQESIKEFEDKSANTKSAYDIVSNVYKGNNDDLREELIHSIAASKNLDVREKAINQSLADLSDGLISNYSLRSSDSQSPELDSWNYLKQHNPTAATLNGDKIVQLLSDSKKLREKRQNYLDLYNSLYTEKGQKDFEDHIKTVQDITQKQKEKVQQEEVDAKVEKDKKDNIKETKAKVETIKNTPTPEVGNIDNTKAIDNDNIPNINFDEEENKDIIPREPEEIKQDISGNTDSHIEAVNNGDEETINNTLTKEQELKQELVQSTNTIVPEETVVVKLEDHKELVTQRDVILHEDGLVKNSTADYSRRIGKLTSINLDRRRTTPLAIAYLGQNKIGLNIEDKDGNFLYKTYNTFNDDGSVQINENVDTKLFSQNYYKPRDKVSMKVPSFEEMQQRGLQEYTEVNYLDDINSVEEFPIAIYSSDNKIIGYLPTQSGIDRLIPEEFKQQALDQNLAIRQNIFDNKDNTYNTSITSKSPGFLILDHPDNQKSLFEALGDKTKLADKVKLGITKLGELYTGNKILFSDGDIVNPDIEEGVVYSIVPSSEQDKYVSYPMKTNTIGQNNANTIVEAIRLFAKGTGLTESEEKSLDNITEFNFKNFDDVTAFVNKIMYASSKSDASEYTTFKLYKDNLILSKTSDEKFSLKDIVDNGSVRQRIASILSDRYYSVSLDNLNSKKSYTSYSLDINGVIQEKENQSYQHYLNDNSVITSNIRGVQIEDNEYTFTTQPVIGLSDTITKDTKQLQQSNTIDNLEPIEPIESKPIELEEVESSKKLTKKTLFDPSKVKPKSFEDINPEFIEQQNIQSGEDLKNKCL